MMSLYTVEDPDLAMLQAQDLLDGIYLSIAIDLGDAGIPHIQQLASAHALWGSQGWLTHFMECIQHCRPHSSSAPA